GSAKETRRYMADLVAANEGQESQSAAESRLGQLSRIRQNQSLRVLGFIIVFASVLMSSVSFLILSGITTIEPSPAVWTVSWVVTGLLALPLAALLVPEAVLLVQARLNGVPGGGRQVRTVAMFAFVAAVPAALVAVVATTALNQGLDQW